MKSSSLLSKLPMKKLGGSRSTFLHPVSQPQTERKKHQNKTKSQHTKSLLPRKLNPARRSRAPTPQDKAGAQVGRHSRMAALLRSCSQHPWVCYLWLDRLLKPDLLAVSAEIVHGNWEEVDPPCHRVQGTSLPTGSPAATYPSLGSPSPRP